MKWIPIDTTLVDTAKYRIFKLDRNYLFGTSDYGDESEIVAEFSSTEQAEEAFRDLVCAPSNVKTE